MKSAMISCYVKRVKSGKISTKVPRLVVENVNLMKKHSRSLICHCSYGVYPLRYRPLYLFFIEHIKCLIKPMYKTTRRGAESFIGHVNGLTRFHFFSIFRIVNKCLNKGLNKGRKVPKHQNDRQN